jgi:hypothetical protein
VTGGTPIAFCSQSISGESAIINSLAAFYDIHGRNREVLFFYSVPDTTRNKYLFNIIIIMPILLLKTYSDQSAALQAVQHCQISPVNFQTYLLRHKIQILMGSFDSSPVMLLSSNSLPLSICRPPGTESRTSCIWCHESLTRVSVAGPSGCRIWSWGRLHCHQWLRYR